MLVHEPDRPLLSCRGQGCSWHFNNEAKFAETMLSSRASFPFLAVINQPETYSSHETFRRG